MLKKGSERLVVGLWRDWVKLLKNGCDQKARRDWQQSYRRESRNRRRHIQDVLSNAY